MENQQAPAKRFTYTLSQELMTGVIEYMVRRPYAEVFSYIDALRQVPAQEVLPELTPAVTKDTTAKAS